MAVINNNMVYKVSINLSSNQLDMTACCGIRDDMGFMEAILGLRQSHTLSKLVYKYPLLFVVMRDCATLSILCKCVRNTVLWMGGHGNILYVWQ